MTDAPKTHLNIVEVRKPEIDATLVAQSIAQQLERRVAFRRAMKRAVQSAMRLGAEGIKHQLLGPSRRRRNRPHSSGIAKVACRCTRCAPTSTTARLTATPPMGSAASRCGSSRAKSSSTIRWPQDTSCVREDAQGPSRQPAGRETRRQSPDAA